MRYFLNTGRVVALVFAALQVMPALAQSRFLTVLNTNQNNGDAVRTVSYYDADNFNNGPLFAVYIGQDEFQNNEDPESITVDPVTGDIYVTAFDSGGAGADSGETGARFDSDGDWDLYKIPFATTYYNWLVNFKGKDVRTLGLVGGPAPTAGAYKNATNLDYVTFAREIDGGTLGSFSALHSNRSLLAGSIVKIGEVKRNDPGSFFNTALEFIDQETIFMVDNTIAPSGVGTPATDITYRLLERVSTSPGLANDAGLDNLDGGFNRGASQSWNSTRAGLMNLDFDPNGAPAGHSEAASSSAFYTNGAVRGVWLAEDDAISGGDDIVFYDLNASALSGGTLNDNGNAVYRPLVSPSGFTGTSLGLYNNPADFADPNAGAPNGKIDRIFVDKTNGDLIVVESGFGDDVDPNGPDGPIGPEHQPGVYRLPIITYDDGSGQIVFGTPGPKFLLDAHVGFTQTPGDDPNAFTERGGWSAFDSTTNTIYIVNPGGAAPESPQFGMDVWTINVDTGVVQSFLDLDDSISLQLSDPAADAAVEFFEALAGDFDYDGDVDGNDFLLWQLNGSPNGATLAGRTLDLAVWELNYGMEAGVPVPPLAANIAVPEPATGVMLGMGLLLMPALRRNRRG